MVLTGMDGRLGMCKKVLLEAKADVEKADDHGWTPLHWASDSGYAECVKVLCCDTFSFCVDEKTISSLSLLQLLIDWKANVNVKTISGGSPLLWVAYGGNVASIEV